MLGDKQGVLTESSCHCILKLDLIQTCQSVHRWHLRPPSPPIPLPPNVWPPCQSAQSSLLVLILFHQPVSVAKNHTINHTTLSPARHPTPKQPSTDVHHVAPSCLPPCLSPCLSPCLWCLTTCHVGKLIK